MGSQKSCQKISDTDSCIAFTWRSIPTTAYVNIINASKLHCGLDFFTYRNLFQNEISDDFCSKLLLKLLIHSNVHIHNYWSLKKRWILEFEIGFQLFSSSILLEPRGIVTFDLHLIKFIFIWFIRLDIILIVCSHKKLLFSCNYHLVIDRNNLDNISTILLAIFKKKFFKIAPLIAHYLPLSSRIRSLQWHAILSVAVNAVQ